MTKLHSPAALLMCQASVLKCCTCPDCSRAHVCSCMGICAPGRTSACWLLQQARHKQYVAQVAATEWLPCTLPYPAKAAGGSATLLSSGCSHDSSPEPSLLPGYQHKQSCCLGLPCTACLGSGPSCFSLMVPLALPAACASASMRCVAARKPPPPAAKACISQQLGLSPSGLVAAQCAERQPLGALFSE